MINKTAVNNLGENYQFKNKKSVNKLNNLNNTIFEIKKTLKPYTDLEKLYGELAENIKQDPNLKQKKLPIPEKDIEEFGFSKKEYTFADIINKNLSENDKQMMIDYGAVEMYLDNLFKDEKIVSTIKQNNAEIFEKIDKIMKKTGATNISGKGIPTKSILGHNQMSDFDWYSTNMGKKVANLEKKAYIQLLDFLASEGKLKGTTFYPGGGGDYYFSRKGINLIVQDPSFWNPKNEELKEQINVKNKIVKGSAIHIPKMIDKNTTFPDFNTLIIKCGLFATDENTPIIYNNLIQKMKPGDNVIEWQVGFHQNPKELGLVEDPITNVLQKINESHNFMFYDPSHHSLNFKVWTKK